MGYERRGGLSGAAGGGVPDAHAASHTDGGADEVTIAEAQVTGLTAALAAKASTTALSNHEADTTNIHGIIDTSALATVTQAKTEILMIAVGDETTAITTGNGKVTFRMPFAMTLTAVRASLTSASSSGIPTVDINEAGTTILSTKLTIDANEKTSTTAATAAVISDSALADDAEITIDIDVAGTGAAGLKVTLIGTRA